MNDELRNCPFCCGKVSIIEVTERPDAFVEETFIQCEECGFSFHHKWLSTETLIKYWNKREERTCHTDERTTTRHGKFKTKYGNRVPLCECCGYSIGDKRYNFCPKCGARVVE